MSNFQKPKGTNDVYYEELNYLQYIIDLFKLQCANYGFKEIICPIFENVNVFKRENDSSDMVNKEMYIFDNDRFALRPEGTAGVIRAVVENKLYTSDLPLKLFYAGKMFRKERPQKGRYREFNQLGVEIISEKSPLIDAECIALGYYFLNFLGLSDIKILVNSLGDFESRKNYEKRLKEHFKDHLDELCEDCKKRYETNPLRILDCKIDKDKDCVKMAPKIGESLSVEAKEYFNKVLSYLDALEIPYEIDERLVRGLDYYTDTVFEVVSTNKESGAQATLFAGGRYDNLVSELGGPNLSGMGFAMGLERIAILAKALNIEFDYEDELDIYIIDMTKSNPYILSLASFLRNSGYKVDINFFDRKLKAQFKTVERKKAKAVIIMGDDELKEGLISLKIIESQKQFKIKEEELIKVLDAELNGDDDHHHHH